MKTALKFSVLVFSAAVACFSLLSGCAEDEQQQAAQGNNGKTADSLAQECSYNHGTWMSNSKQCICNTNYEKSAEGVCVENAAFKNLRLTCQNKSGEFNETTGACKETPASCSLQPGKVLMPSVAGVSTGSCTDINTARNYCQTMVSTTSQYNAADGTCSTSTSADATLNTGLTQAQLLTKQQCDLRSVVYNQATNTCIETQDSCNRQNMDLNGTQCVQRNSNNGIWGAVGAGIQVLPNIINSIKN